MPFQRVRVFNVCEYSSLDELCAAVAWKLPAKVYAPTRETMAQFLEIMERDHAMTWDEFWFLKIGEGDTLVDYANTPTKAAIETMEMFGEFVNDVNGSGGL